MQIFATVTVCLVPSYEQILNTSPLHFSLNDQFHAIFNTPLYTFVDF